MMKIKLLSLVSILVLLGCSLGTLDSETVKRRPGLNLDGLVDGDIGGNGDGTGGDGTGGDGTGGGGTGGDGTGGGGTGGDGTGGDGTGGGGTGGDGTGGDGDTSDNVDIESAVDVPVAFRNQMANLREYNVYIDQNTTQAFRLHTQVNGGSGSYGNLGDPVRGQLLSAIQSRVRPIVSASGTGNTISMAIPDSKTITIKMSGITTKFYVKYANATFTWYQEITSSGKEGSLAFIGGDGFTSATSLNKVYENFPQFAELPVSVISLITATRIRMTLSTPAGAVQSFIFFDTAP
ncbi:MAG: hypothetical protein ACRCY4_06265 [Brevinema sp.]